MDPPEPEPTTRLAWFYPENPWGSPRHWLKPHMRGQRFLALWDVVTFFACLYVAWAVPYKLGYLSVEGARDCTFSDDRTLDLLLGNTRVNLEIGLGWMDVITDIFFVADIVLSFHTATWIISRQGRPHWVLIETLPEIRRRYIRGLFFFDMIGVIPVQYVDCVFEESHPAPAWVKGLHLIRLAKLLRLYRLRKFVKDLYVNFPKLAVWLTLFELLTTLSLAAHWMSCIWFRTGYPDGWVLGQEITSPVLNEETGLVDYERKKDNLWFEWITSFYFAITTMTTIGYGDITAHSASERVVAVVMMVMGCVYFAWITGNIASILGKKDSSIQRFDDQMDQLSQYLESRNIPKSMQTQIQSFYMLRFPNSRVYDEDEILRELPDGIRKDISLFLTVDVVESCPILQHCSSDAKAAICYMLRPSFHAPGVQITSEDEEADALYIVRFGSVSVYAKDELLCEMKQGDVFGENAIFGLSPTGRRTRRVVAKTMCELCVLKREDCMQIMCRHKSFQWTIQRMTKLHVDMLRDSFKAEKPVTIRELLCVDWCAVGKRVKMTLDAQHLKEMHAGLLSLNDDEFNKGLVDDFEPNSRVENISMEGRRNTKLKKQDAMANSWRTSSQGNVNGVKPRLKTRITMHLLNIIGENVVHPSIKKAKGIFVCISWPGDGLGTFVSASSEIAHLGSKDSCECEQALDSGDSGTSTRGRHKGDFHACLLQKGWRYTASPSASSTTERVVLELTTGSNDWKHMPPLDVHVYVELNYDDVSRHPQGGSRSASRDIFGEVQNANDLHTSESCLLLGHATVPIMQIISGRGRGRKNQDAVTHCLIMKPIPDEVDPEMHKALGGDLETEAGRWAVTFQISALRQLGRQSVWRKLMRHLRSNPTSEYFLRKQRKQMEEMEKRINIFAKEVYRQRRNVYTSETIANTVSDHEEVLRCFREMEHRQKQLQDMISTLQERINPCLSTLIQSTAGPKPQALTHLQSVRALNLLTGTSQTTPEGNLSLQNSPDSRPNMSKSNMSPMGACVSAPSTSISAPDSGRFVGPANTDAVSPGAALRSKTSRVTDMDLFPQRDSSANGQGGELDIVDEAAARDDYMNLDRPTHKKLLEIEALRRAQRARDREELKADWDKQQEANRRLERKLDLILEAVGEKPPRIRKAPSGLEITLSPSNQRLDCPGEENAQPKPIVVARPVSAALGATSEGASSNGRSGSLTGREDEDSYAGKRGRDTSGRDIRRSLSPFSFSFSNGRSGAFFGEDTRSHGSETGRETRRTASSFSFFNGNGTDEREKPIAEDSLGQSPGHVGQQLVNQATHWFESLGIGSPRQAPPTARRAV